MKRICEIFFVTAVLCLLALCQSGLAETLTLPADLTEVEEEAFYGDASIENVVFPEGIEVIGSRAFAGCGLREVYLPGSLTEIADDAFDGPDKVTIKTEKYSYAYFWAARNGYIVSSITYADNGDGTVTITGYTDEDEALTIPAVIDGKTVTAIGDGVFRGNTTLTSVVLPDTLVRIGDEAFYGCTGLSSRPVLPLGLREIGDRAFNGVKGRILILPRSLTHIGEDAFTGFTYIRVYNWTYSYDWADKLTYYDASIYLTIFYSALTRASTDMAGEGDLVTCTAFSFDDEVESIHWQRSFDYVNWTDCEGEGADQAEYSFIASAENCGCYYRVRTTDFTGTYYSKEFSVGYMGNDCRISSAHVAGTNISVSWDAIWTGFTYSLYMTGPDGTETALAEDIEENFFDVTGLEPQTAYTFRLEARYEDRTVESVPVSVMTQNYRTGTVYRALLIGEVSFYDGDILDSLGDLDILGNMLQHVTGPKGNAYSCVRKLDLTYDEIHAAIQTTFADADEDDVSLLFIATHGVDFDDYGKEYIGALTAPDHETLEEEYIKDTTLAEWLSEIPGEVVVILEACSSGSMIYDDSDASGEDVALDAMNAAVISAFREKDEALDLNGVGWRFDEDGNAEQIPSRTPRIGGLRSTKFHVMTSSAHMEDSFGYDQSPFPHTKFTYGLTQGVGESGAMPCDVNGDGLAAMNELAAFIDAFHDPYLPYTTQRVQLYPENSDYALFRREN